MLITFINCFLKSDYMIEKRGTILNYIIKDIKISPRKVEKFKKDVLVMD